MNLIKPRLVLPALVLASLALAAPAHAVDRFATPGGPASGTCLTEGTACDLEFAIENASVDGDVIKVLPGTYTETTGIFTTKAIEINGPAGQPFPTLNSTFAGPAIGIGDANAAIRRLRIVHDPGATAAKAVALDTDGGTLEHVVASTASTSAGSAACGTSNTTGNVLIRDSICFATNNSDGMDFNVDGTTSVFTLRNVTVSGRPGQTGIGSNAGAGEATTINASNVIAEGGLDIFAQGVGTTTFTLDHSNYDSEAGTGGATVTDPGTATNQTAAPAFVNAAGGDFHQTAASPTRNAGIGGAGLGTLDIDGEARSQGAAPDIGADEFTEAPPAPPDGDADGVPDASDACPSQAGPASNNGCPLPADGGGGDTGGGGDSGGGMVAQAVAAPPPTPTTPRPRSRRSRRRT